MSPDSIIAIAGILLIAGAFSNKLSNRFNLPTLLLFLTVGIFAETMLPFEGSRYAAEINFFGVIAMSFILFAGGAETSPATVKKVAFRGILLALPGVMLTALILGTGAYFFLGMKFSYLWCLLLASLISSTDAAAVFAVLRGRNIGLKGKLKPLLEFESGSNDPAAAFLTVSMISALTAASAGKSENFGFFDIIIILYQLGGGILAGIAAGWLGRKIFHIKLEYEGLYFVVSVAWILLCYGLPQCVGINGFMTCYVCGIVMNSGRYNYQKALTKFHNGIAWLMQVGLFTALGFLADPQELLQPGVWLPGIALGLFLMFVARPLAVFICLIHSEFKFREKILISWVGIRGAAAIVLATFPLAAGVADAEFMFRLIFFMVLISVLLQSRLLMPLARILKLAKTDTGNSAPAPLELETTHGTASQEMREYKVAANSRLAGKTLAEIHFPTGVLVTMIRRGNSFIPPNGNTAIHAGDGMLIMAETQLLKEVAKTHFPGQHQE